MKNTLIFISSIATFIACSPAKQPVSTIDSALQTKADSILQEKMREINAHKGQVIVMEVQSGEVKAMVGLEREETTFVPYEYTAQPAGLMKTVSLLAALETGKVKLSDVVDVGNGIIEIDGSRMRDHNWHRGGYGELTIKQALAVGSNIGTYLAMKKAFGENRLAYFDQLDRMNYDADLITPKDSLDNEVGLAWSCIGYNQAITPLQMLTFYNAIANNGKMVQPLTYKDSTIVINPQIASRANIDSMKVALRSVVTDGLGKLANSKKVQVAGKTGTIQISENEDYNGDMTHTEFATSFCGYFPADNPKYSIIVTLNKTGLPASGGLMAGSLFRQVVDIIE